MSPRARLSVDFEWTAKQRQFLRAVRDAEGLGPHVYAFLGGWGSGKSTCAAAAFAMWCLRLRGDADGYRPQTAVIGPTARVVEKVLQPKLASVLPREVIAKKVGRPFPTWRLINGVDVSFVSAEATFEGEDLAAIWVDEVHTLASDPTKFQNYLARLRDKRAKQITLLASGLPESGWTRDTFDPEQLRTEDRRLRHTILVGTSDNPHLPKDLIQQFLASCPSGYEEALIRGGWMPPQNALYPMFSDENIVPSSRWDPRAPVSVGLDAGQTSAAVVGQRDGPGVLIGRDYVLKAASVEDMCKAVRDDFAGQIIPGHSTICCDPTIRSDEVAAIRRVFPSVRILIRKRTDPFYDVRAGTRLVQAAICNAEGKRHLHIVERCRSTRGGVIESLRSTQVNPRSGERRKLDCLDHAEDATRYLMNHMLGDQGFAPQVVR